jgi:uncharacterized membrane protein YhaH (DUF805 family)
MRQNLSQMPPSKRGLLLYLECFQPPLRLGRVKFTILRGFWALSLYLSSVIPYRPPFDTVLTLPHKVCHNVLIVVGIVLISLYILNTLRLKIRRLHDFNVSGWWLLLIFIPFFGVLWDVALFIIPGSQGDNRYGAPVRKPQPKESLAALILSLAVVVEYIHILSFSWRSLFAK